MVLDVSRCCGKCVLNCHKKLRDNTGMCCMMNFWFQGFCYMTGTVNCVISFLKKEMCTWARGKGAVLTQYSARRRHINDESMFQNGSQFSYLHFFM